MLRVQFDSVCGRIAGEGKNWLGLRTRKQIERGEVRDHQRGHIDDRDPVRSGQLPGERRKVELDAMAIVDEDVSGTRD
jgi:hypothetical protein